MYYDRINRFLLSRETDGSMRSAIVNLYIYKQAVAFVPCITHFNSPNGYYDGTLCANGSESDCDAIFMDWTIRAFDDDLH